MRQLLIVFFYLIFISACSPTSEEITEALPNAASKSFTSQVDNEQQKQQLIKENKRCIRCHKIPRKIKQIPAMPMLGKHANKEFFDNCTACHGIKGDHPKEDGTIIDLSAHSKVALTQHNNQCMQCHNPERLRQTEWTHDVHYQKINCSSCHQLHQIIDPIKNISAKKRIQLCVDCHQKDKDMI